MELLPNLSIKISLKCGILIPIDEMWNKTLTEANICIEGNFYHVFFPTVCSYIKNIFVYSP